MLHIEIQSAAVEAALRRLADAAEDMTPAMQDIGEYLIESSRRRFQEGTAPDGTPWAPKSETTLSAMAARGDRPDARPLFGASRRLSSEFAYSADAQGVEQGSSLVYAAVQQLGARKGQFGRTRRGGPIPWGDIPARPFVGLSEADGSAIAEIVAEHLAGSLDGG